MKKTLVMGASTNPSRYSYMAAERLTNKSIDIELFGKSTGNIFETEIKTDLNDISKDFHTVTMYLSETNQKEYEEFLLSLNPKRVIFNPGAENESFEEKLESKGIEVVHGCTLVMLGTGQF